MSEMSELQLAQAGVQKHYSLMYIVQTIPEQYGAMKRIRSVRYNMNAVLNAKSFMTCGKAMTLVFVYLRHFAFVFINVTYAIN